jgi:hypothetical protein
LLHTLLPIVLSAALTAGCVSDGFVLPGLDGGASRGGAAPLYPGPGDLPYLYGYPAPFGDPWYGYGPWPPYLYFGPYGYGYGYGLGYGPGYGYGSGYGPYPPRPPGHSCRDANADGRCDGHPNRPARAAHDPVRPGDVPWPADPSRPGVPATGRAATTIDANLPER